MGTFAGIGAGAAGPGPSLHFHCKLSQELKEDTDKVADSLLSLHGQINSLAAVMLQNQGALDLLTAEKGGACVLLGEECC